MKSLRELGLVDGLTDATPFVVLNGLTSTEKFVELGRALGDTYKHRDADLDGVTKIESRTATGAGLEGFGMDSLKIHTDSSAAEEPPRLILFRCVTPANSGGWSRVVNVQNLVVSLLEKQNRDLLETLTHPEACELHSGDDVYRGPIINLDGNGPLVRLRQDNLATFGPAMQGNYTKWLELLKRHTLSFRLQANQGYLADNWSMLHGRSSFRGARRCERILIRN